MNGFFGYLLRTWLGRARSKLRSTLFGVILAIVVVEMLLGVFLVSYAWFDAREMERLATEGIQAEAAIESVDVRFSRGWKIVELKLAWTAAGTTRRQTVQLDEELAPRVVLGHRAIRPTVPIKYLPAEPDANVLFLDDVGRRWEVNMSGTRVGASLLGLGALVLAILYSIRRQVRRKYPALPASYTSWPSWPNIRDRIRMKQTNSFMRVFMQYKYITAPFLAGLTYGLKYIGLFDVLESLAGLSERGAWLILILASVVIMSISGWCYDRYGEWRAATRPQDSIPSVTS